MNELMENIHEAIEGCLSVDLKEIEKNDKSKILEIPI